jgi:hypothetical protein
MSEANDIDGVVMCGIFSVYDYCLEVKFSENPYLILKSVVVHGDDTNILPMMNSRYIQKCMDCIIDAST